MSLRDRITAARGEVPADLLLANGRLVNVLSGEIHPADVAVKDGRVIGLGSYPAHKVVDLGGRFVCPGFIDAHVHLESSMVQPVEFARAVMPRGTTAVVCDPHEIANVLGLDGVRYILKASRHLPLTVYVMAPSCVPATDMETPGATLDARQIRQLLRAARVLGLAEMMNYPGVIYCVPEVLAKLDAAAGRPVDGHAPGLAGKDLNAYVAAGIRSDHECTTEHEAREKLRLGMHIFLREGTTARNLRALLPLVTHANARLCHFCTDDRHPDTLLSEGHVDDLVRKAIAWGLDPILAIQMATLNTAQYFGLGDRGAVAPGYAADLLVLDDLDTIAVAQVYAAGRLVAEQGRLTCELPGARVPLRPSVHADAVAIDFTIRAGDGLARVIGVFPDQVVTEHLRLPPAVRDGLVVSDPERDLVKIAVIERHRRTGRVGLGLVKGTGLRRGAVGSSVAHDSHNLVVIGASDEDMRAAVAAIVQMGGGQVAVVDGEVRAAVPLPVAGLISLLPLEEVRAQGSALAKAARELGCTLPDPLMTLSFLALPVIPALKLTDLGLVDVARFSVVPLFEG